MWAFPGERGIYNFFLPGSVQFGWMSCCSLSWWGHQWDISPLGSWFSWNQKKFLRALLSYHIWLSLVKGSNLAGDRKANSSNETEQRHKPVSSKKRRLNIIFLFKSKFSSGVVNSQGIFFASLEGMTGGNSCKQHQQKAYVQIHTGRTCSSGNTQCYLAGYRRELESSLNPQKQRSCSLGTLLTGQGHGSERRKQLNKAAAGEGFLWVWSRRAVTTWQPAGCMHHNTGSAGLAACSRPLWPQTAGTAPFLYRV